MATQSIPAGYKLVPDAGIETPMAGGKAEAMAAFLASGGAMRGGGRSGRGGAYTKGPLKGKTIDEAKQMFEQRWATAPPAIKDKYANRAGMGAFAPSEKIQIGAIKPTPTNASLNAALPGERAPQMYARQRAERMREAGENPGTPAPSPAKTDVAAEAKRQRDDEMAKASAAMNAKGAPAQTPEQVGAEARRLMNGGATPQSTPTLSPPTPSPASPPAVGVQPMSSLAQREFNRRTAAAAATPTGVPVISQSQADAYKGPKMGSVNRLTGLPFGYQPGDKVEGADAAMQARADQSVARQQIAESKAAMAPKPPQLAANISKPAFQPETRYTPGLGNVPVAKPVTDGSEQVSYDAYEAAGKRMRTAGGNATQDSQDAALRSQFDKQAFQRQADEMRRRRQASLQPAYNGPGVIRPVTVGRRS